MAFFAVCVKSTVADETWARMIKTSSTVPRTGYYGWGSSFIVVTLACLLQLAFHAEIHVLKQVCNPTSLSSYICIDVHSHTLSQAMEIPILVFLNNEYHGVYISKPDEVTFRTRLHIVIGSWSICKTCMMLGMMVGHYPVRVYPPDFKAHDYPL